MVLTLMVEMFPHLLQGAGFTLLSGVTGPGESLRITLLVSSKIEIRLYVIIA